MKLRHLVFGAGILVLVLLTANMLRSLSSDAIGMAVGVLFGVFAGVPTALLVLASNRRREFRDDGDDGSERGDYNPYSRRLYAPGPPAYPPREDGAMVPYQPQMVTRQPHIVVLAAPAPRGGTYPPALTGAEWDDDFDADYYTDGGRGAAR